MERLRQQEDEEEERKIAEYREIGLRLKGYPEEDVRKARRLVASFIMAAEEVEEVISYHKMKTPCTTGLTFFLFVIDKFRI